MNKLKKFVDPLGLGTLLLLLLQTKSNAGVSKKSYELANIEEFFCGIERLMVSRIELYVCTGWSISGDVFRFCIHLVTDRILLLFMTV